MTGLDYTTPESDYHPKSDAALELVGSGHGPGVFIPFEILELTEDVATALIFSQMLYWASKMKFKAFYKSDAEWCNELKISRSVLRRVIHGDKRYENGRMTLKDLGVETSVEMANGAPTTHYRINFATLDLCLSGNALSAKQTVHCMLSRQSITEEYQKTTEHSTESADAPLFVEADKPDISSKKTRSAHREMVGALLSEMGISKATKADYSKAGSVAKELLRLELTVQDVPGLIQHVRNEAAGKWKVTLTSLTTNGRVSEYVKARDKDYTIVETPDNTTPLNMDQFLVNMDGDDDNSE